MPSLSAEDIQKLSFEQALEQLNTLVSHLETGDLSLEENIQSFELGVQLNRHCEALLDHADQRLNTLSASKP